MKDDIEDREIEEFVNYMLTHPDEDPFNKRRARKSSGQVEGTQGRFSCVAHVAQRKAGKHWKA